MRYYRASKSIKSRYASAINFWKALKQLVWRLPLRWKNASYWKTCSMSMFSQIFRPYKHVLVALFRKQHYLGSLCDNWKPWFLPCLIFNWRAFSRRVTACWWGQCARRRFIYEGCHNIYERPVMVPTTIQYTKRVRNLQLLFVD